MSSSSSLRSQESSESEQLLARDLRVSDLGAFMHCLKAFIGIGILSLPWAVKHAGIVVGPILILAIGIMSTHAMTILVNSSRHLCKKLDVSCLNFGEVVYYAVLFGPIKSLRKHASKAEVLVNICIVFTQFGYCSAYLVFVAQNIRQVTAVYVPVVPSDRAFIAILWLPLTLTVFIRKLPALAWMSAFANVALLIAFGMMFRYLFTHEPSRTTLFTNSIGELPIFLATAMFAIEGASVILPIQNAMRHPEKFTTVLTIAASVVVVFDTVFATFGYLVFGSNVCSAITLNLPPRNVFYEAARILYTFVLVATFPIQFHVIFEILWSPIEEKFRPQKIFCELLSRAAFVAIICLISLAIPNVGDINALIGASVTISLQFIFPPAIQLMVFHSGTEHVNTREELTNSLLESEPIVFEVDESRDEKLLSETDSATRLSTFTVVKNCAILGIGLLGMVTGTIAAIRNIIKNLENYSVTSICNGGLSQIISINESATKTPSPSFTSPGFFR